MGALTAALVLTTDTIVQLLVGVMIGAPLLIAGPALLIIAMVLGPPSDAAERRTTLREERRAVEAQLMQLEHPPPSVRREGGVPLLSLSF